MRFLADWLLTGCAVVAIMIVVVVRPVLARTHLHCSTTQVVIVSASTGKTSSRSEENLSFVIDDAAKTVAFAEDNLWRLPASTAIGSAQTTMTLFTNSIAKAAR